MSMATIRFSYAAGSIAGSGALSGGIAGYAQSSWIYKSFWDTEATTQGSSSQVSEGTVENNQPPYTGPGTGLRSSAAKMACPSGTSVGICALGEGFSYEQGKYPKVKKCTNGCLQDNPANYQYGSELLGGQNW